MTPDRHKVTIDTQTKFILSTSGSQSSIERHNNALSKLGLNLVYFTFSHDISPDAYASLIRSPIVRGAAVTGKDGLKSSIIPYLDKVEPLAERTLAVNTVVNQGGKLLGYNTDAVGLRAAIIRGIKEYNLDIRKAVIYGNGGVSGVAYRVLEDLGIPAAIIGRNEERVNRKRSDLGIDSKPILKGPYHLVVDATPISSNPDFLNAPGFSDILQGCKAVFCHNMPEKDNKPNYLADYCMTKKINYIPGTWMYNTQLIKQYILYLEGYKKSDGNLLTEADIKDAWEIG